MRRYPWLGLLLLLVTPAAALGQAFPAVGSFWEISPHLGFFAPEEPEGAEIEARPLFGARAAHRRAAGFGLELYAAFTPLELEVAGAPPEEVDLPTFLYGAEGLYTWPITPRSDFSLTAGVGGVTWLPDREAADADTETNLQLTLGAAARYLIGSSIALRGDVRDHIVFDQLADTARSLRLGDRGNTNNLELSLGASFVVP